MAQGSDAEFKKSISAATSWIPGQLEHSQKLVK